MCYFVYDVFSTTAGGGCSVDGDTTSCATENLTRLLRFLANMANFFIQPFCFVQHVLKAYPPPPPLLETVTVTPGVPGPAP